MTTKRKLKMKPRAVRFSDEAPRSGMENMQHPYITESEVAATFGLTSINRKHRHIAVWICSRVGQAAPRERL
jgi:hypothetical protein